MKRVIQFAVKALSFILIAFTPCSTSAEGRIHIEYLPAGKRLEVEGVEYIGYDLEGVKELARIDAAYGERGRKIGLLEEQLELKELRIAFLERDLDTCKETVEKLSTNEPSAEGSFWSQTEHLAIELLLIVIVGGLIYAVAK